MGLQSVYSDGGIKAVCLAALDRLRQVLGKDFRPMQFYEEADSAVAVDPNVKLAHIIDSHDGNIITKWGHYAKIYETHFARFRGTEVRFLEIGVFKGGSLDVWRKYFGEDAKIFGIDINPDCAQFNGQSGEVRIGSQANADFLLSVVEEMGGVDIVLDDGSHNSQHMRKTLETLFPLLENGGVYMIEDLHCAYLPRFGGGYRWPWSFMKVIKEIVDDMHHWYHRHGIKHKLISDHVEALHMYDSIVVIDKMPQSKPVSFHRPAKS